MMLIHLDFGLTMSTLFISLVLVLKQPPVQLIHLDFGLTMSALFISLVLVLKQPPVQQVICVLVAVRSVAVSILRQLCMF